MWSLWSGGALDGAKRKPLGSGADLDVEGSSLNGLRAVLCDLRAGLDPAWENGWLCTGMSVVDSRLGGPESWSEHIA